MKTIKKSTYLVLVVVMVIAIIVMVGSVGCKQEVAEEITEVEEAEAEEAEAEEAEVEEVESEETSEVIEEVKKVRMGYAGTIEFLEAYDKSMAQGALMSTEALGAEMVTADFDFTPEGLIKAIEELASQDVDVLQFYNLADQLMPPVQAICDEAGVAYMGSAPVGDEMWTQLKDDPLFLGTIYEENTQSCYEMIIKMSEMGVKNLLVLSTPAGNPYAEERKIGLNNAIEETGINLLPLAENLLTADDVAKAVENTLITYPEVDGIFVIASTVPEIYPTTMKILDNHNLLGKVVVGGYNVGQEFEYMENGLDFISVTPQYAKFVAAFAACINYANGTYEQTEPVIYYAVNDLFTKQEEFENYNKYISFAETEILTIEEIQEALSGANPEEIQAWLTDFSLEYVMDLHAKR